MFLDSRGRQAGYSVWGKSGFLTASSPTPTWRMGVGGKAKEVGKEGGRAGAEAEARRRGR